jgi:hypothetical protein
MLWKKKQFRILFVLLAVTVLSPSIALSQKIVRSSGIGVILKGDVETARERAMEKAFQSALQESIAGIARFTDISNYKQAVEKLLSEDPLYYIDRYRILTDKTEENLYKIVMEVWVSDEKIKNRLSETGMIGKSSKIVRLGILVNTKTDKQTPREFFKGQESEFTAYASQQCRSRGFQVIGGAITIDDSPRSFEKLRVNNQLTALQGRRIGADAILLGQVEIRTEGSRMGIDLPGDYHVHLWVRAIRSTDGSMLGLRESNFTLKQNISTFMLRQLIQQNLDSVLGDLGEDLRGKLN